MSVTKTVSRILVISGAIALSGTPAAFAVSGPSSATDDSAAAAQYSRDEVAPETTSGGADNGGVDHGGAPELVQRQQGAGAATPSTSSLPFTGGPVLPLVLAALVLVAAGAALRASSSDRHKG